MFTVNHIIYIYYLINKIKWKSKIHLNLRKEKLIENFEMQEITETPSKPFGMNHQYKPPIFKKDFFDSLIKKENPDTYETEREEKPIEETNLIKKFMTSFKNKEDTTAHEVII